MCVRRPFFGFVILLGLVSFSFMGCKKNISTETATLKADSVIVKPLTADAIKALLKNSQNELTILNLWASWCVPCRAEFPQLLSFRKKWNGKGLKFQFLSADFATDLPEVKKFLAEQNVDFETYIREGDDQAFINGIDSTWSGALPTTFIFSSDGKILHRFDGEVTERILESKVLEIQTKFGKQEPKK